MSAFLGNNTISYKVSLSSPFQELTCTAGPIYPGYLCEQVGSDSVSGHSIADEPAETMFAVENSQYRGKTIYDRYEVGERVMLRVCRKGDIILAAVASVQEIPINSYVTSAGYGPVHPKGIAPIGGSIVGVSIEAHAAAAPGNIDLIAIRIM
jgi:hypothetical protein